MKKPTLRSLHESLLIEGTCSKCGRQNVLTSKIDGKEVCYYGCSEVRQTPSEEPSVPDQISPSTDRIDTSVLWQSLVDLVMESWQNNGDGPSIPEAVRNFVKKHPFDREMWKRMDENDVSFQAIHACIKKYQEDNRISGTFEHYVEQAFELLGDHAGIDWDEYNAKEGA